jgi:membrane associated rhomboid family serine protease
LIKTDDMTPSAGASGALFGLIGVLFDFGLKYRRELPEGFKRAFGTGMLPVILLNLGIGFLARGIIDNAAHLGGLLSGAAIASVIGYKRPGTPASVTLAWRVLQIAALLLVAVCFYMVVRHFE